MKRLHLQYRRMVDEVEAVGRAEEASGRMEIEALEQWVLDMSVPTLSSLSHSNFI